MKSSSRDSKGTPSKADSLAGIQSSRGLKGTSQQNLELSIDKEIEINGIGMGVMSDGTPYLNRGGLARLCGVAPKQITAISQEWGSSKPRNRKFVSLIESLGKPVPKSAYVSLEYQSSTHHCFPDIVCLAVLEYYAFDAAKPTDSARTNYRLLAGSKLSELIYKQVGYDPSGVNSARFEKWHERLALNYQSAPEGYFSIFNESSSIFYEVIMAGIPVDEKTVMDISIGRLWSSYWESKGLDNTFSRRRKYPHRFPDTHPQSHSNPQDAWCYPVEALGEFKKWLISSYVLEGKLRNYINRKLSELPVLQSMAKLAITKIEDKARGLPAPKN